MKTYKFNSILVNGEWKENYFISIDEKGLITGMDEVTDSADYEMVGGYAIPGFRNAHSHAFQYAMAGLAELHSPGNLDNDFWAWRETMYKIALQISPDQLEAIAAVLYAEMLRHGYTHVAEFHYVHHQDSGKAFNNPAEMGERLMSAAEKTGMKLSLIPIFYRLGGFNQAPGEGQRRFISPSVDAYIRLFESSKEAARHFRNTEVLSGYHSLRAVSLEDIKQTAHLSNGEAVHIHIAEQLKEIDDCVAYSGMRPVEYLADSVQDLSNWHLVHATHLSDGELNTIIERKAKVVLCPTTEGNLGDGFFRLREFLAGNGDWSIGTDSHISLDPKEEIRLLDYGQRLSSHKRNTFVNERSGESALNAYLMALKAGNAAMHGALQSEAKPGSTLDLCVLDDQHPLMAGIKPELRMSTAIYAGDSSFVTRTMTNGVWRVEDGKHQEMPSLSTAFRKALDEIRIRL